VLLDFTDAPMRTAPCAGGLLKTQQTVLVSVAGDVFDKEHAISSFRSGSFVPGVTKQLPIHTRTVGRSQSPNPRDRPVAMRSKADQVLRL
jgi:hypothetical protein